MTHIQIINPTLHDKNRLQEFYAQIYRPDHVLMNDAFLQWWLRDNPFWKGDGFSCKIAVDGEKIVGHFAYVPVPIWAMGKTYSGAWTGNFIVDELYRGKGIGGVLIKSIMDEYQATMDVGANAPAEIILQKKGWKHFGNLHRYVGIFDPEKASLFAINPLALQCCVIKNLGVTYDNIQKIEQFSSDHDVFWGSYKKEILASTERTSEFLNWRYTKHPLFRYHIFEARNASSVSGFLVFRVDPIKDSLYTAIRIVECLGGAEATRSLVQRAIEYAHTQNAVLVDFFSASKKFGDIFKEFGFCDAPYSNQIARLFSPVTLSSREISFNGANCRGDLPAEVFQDQELWYATSGDGDQDRPNYK